MQDNWSFRAAKSTSRSAARGDPARSPIGRAIERYRGEFGRAADYYQEAMEQSVATGVSTALTVSSPTTVSDQRRAGWPFRFDVQGP